MSPGPTAAAAPCLVFAIGNASRGDDALGPLLAAALQAEGWFDEGGCELIEAFQLQVEDALELRGRAAVLFVDAARPGRLRGADPDANAGVALAAVAPNEPAASLFSHALSPDALLGVYRRIEAAEPPRAQVLAIEGEVFELGAGLSAAARARLRSALALARRWLAGQGCRPAAPASAGTPPL